MEMFDQWRPLSKQITSLVEVVKVVNAKGLASRKAFLVSGGMRRGVAKLAALVSARLQQPKLTVQSQWRIILSLSII